MDIWGILGIEPTREIAKIKKAYAQQLKKHHPEDDPAGFQQLREAYESALKIAKSDKATPIVPVIPAEADADVEDVTEYEKINKFHSAKKAIDKTINSTEDIPPGPSWIDLHPKEALNFFYVPNFKPQFRHKLVQLYGDFFARIEIENWIALFDEYDLMWNINRRNRLEYQLLIFFEAHHHLPHHIWKLLDDYFGWSHQKGTYNSRIFAPLLNYITKQITNPSIPSYSDIKYIKGFDYERFLNSREIALGSSMEKILEEPAQYYRTHAKMVYPEDPRLPEFLGRYYFKVKDFRKAKGYIKKAIQLAPTDKMLPALLTLVNREIRTGPGWNLIKKIRHSDQCKRFYGNIKEFGIHVCVFIVILIFISIVVFLVNTYKKIFVPVKGFAYADPQEIAELVEPTPITITESNIDQIPQSKKVTVRFDQITYLKLVCSEKPNAGKDSVKRDFLISPSGFGAYMSPRVALGRLNQMEIVLIGPPNWGKENSKDPLTFTGYIYDEVSPGMYRGIFEELGRMNAPDVALKVVFSKYIVADIKDKRAGAISQKSKKVSQRNDWIVFIILPIFLGFISFMASKFRKPADYWNSSFKKRF